MSEPRSVSIYEALDILADAIENGEIEPREGLRLLAKLKNEDRGMDDEIAYYIADDLQRILNWKLGKDVEVSLYDEEYNPEDLRNEIDYTIRKVIDRLKEKGVLPADFKTELTPVELAKRIIEGMKNDETCRAIGRLNCYFRELPLLRNLASFVDDEDFIRTLEDDARRARYLEIYENIKVPKNIEEEKRKVRELLQDLEKWLWENGFIDESLFGGYTFGDRYKKLFVGLSELLPFVRWLKDMFERTIRVRDDTSSREYLSKVLPEIVSKIEEIIYEPDIAGIEKLLKDIAVINHVQRVIEDIPLDEFKEKIEKDLADFKKAIRENGFMLQEA